MKKLLVSIFLTSLTGCAGGMSAFHTWAVAHNAEIASVALVAGAVSQVESAALNGILIGKEVVPDGK